MITENFRLSVLVRYPYILFGVDDATPHLHIVHAHIAFAACYIRKFNIILSKDMLNAHAIIIVCGTVVRGTCGLNSFTCDPVSTLRLLIIMDFFFFFCLVVCVAIATADHITSHGNKSDARCLRAFVSRSVVRFGGHL